MSTRHRVGIIGIGTVPARPTSGDVSYREMIYEAAVKAYENAGVGPEDVDTFVSVAEDLNEGVSIFDEYVPDQLGAVLRPVHTISGDGLYGIASAFLQIKTGVFKIAVVEAHSKASNIMNHRKIMEMAFDPHYLRHLDLDPHFLAGLEMRSYLESGNVKEKCIAKAVTEMRKYALNNPFAAYPGIFTAEDVMNTEVIAEPLREGMIAQFSDGAVVVVLADNDVVRALKKEDDVVWIDGVGFCTSEPSFDTMDFTRATYAELSTRQAYRMAGIRTPLKQLSLAEIDSRYAYKFFQHIEACRLTDGRPVGRLFCDGFFSKEGELPVNLSGSHLGIGLMDEATCLYQLNFAYEVLSGNEKIELKNPPKALVQSWRGIPTKSGSAVVLSKE